MCSHGQSKWLCPFQRVHSWVLGDGEETQLFLFLSYFFFLILDSSLVYPSAKYPSPSSNKKC